VIGLDIPGVKRHHIAAAFAALGRHDAALGPATDRRFWLNGARGVLPPGLFAGMRWSGEHALKDTRASAPKLRRGLAATPADADTGDDLMRQIRRLN